MKLSSNSKKTENAIKVLANSVRVKSTAKKAHVNSYISRQMQTVVWTANLNMIL